jgi:hypothetical protein
MPFAPKGDNDQRAHELITTQALAFVCLFDSTFVRFIVYTLALSDQKK